MRRYKPKAEKEPKRKITRAPMIKPHVLKAAGMANMPVPRIVLRILITARNR
jgi:hypothetical protein